MDSTKYITIQQYIVNNYYNLRLIQIRWDIRECIEALKLLQSSDFQLVVDNFKEYNTITRSVFLIFLISKVYNIYCTLYFDLICYTIYLVRYRSYILFYIDEILKVLLKKFKNNLILEK